MHVTFDRTHMTVGNVLLPARLITGLY